jgi:glycine/D-amino acid oxidase-like deaminating enzyme
MMFDRHNEGQSCWAATSPLPLFPALDRSLDVDVAIIGGGVTAVTAAHLLKQAGVRVALVERDRCGSGQTGRSTAHLTAVSDVPLTRLVERVGAENTRALWDAGFAAVSRVRAEIRDARINCDFAWVRGTLHAPLDVPLTQERAALQREAAIANALGISAAYVDAVPGLARPGVRFDGQARLHPLRYLSVLLDGIDGAGSYVFEQTEVHDIDLDTLTVHAGAHRISARFIVVATHLPLPCVTAKVSDLSLGLDVATTYALSGIAPHGAIEEGIYWEHLDSPYEYLRLDRDGDNDQVVFGGVDHAGTTSAASPDRFARLERQVRQRVPGVRIDRRWSGTIVESTDGRPWIGEVARGVFMATGFGGNGLTYGTLAGMMAVDAARAARSPWQELFDPWRSRLVTDRWSGHTAEREAS